MQHLTRSLGMVVAVTAVAAVVAVLLTTQRSIGPSAGAGASAGPESQAREHASAMLRALVLPPGAVRSRLKAGVPASLWSAPQRLRTPHLLDVTRIWQVPSSVAKTIRLLELRHASVELVSESGETTARTGRGGRPSASAMTVTGATGYFALGPSSASSPFFRQIVVSVQSTAHGGGSFVRADAQVGWFGTTRPAAASLPAGVDRARAVAAGHGRLASFAGARLTRLIALIDSLPAVSSGPLRCAHGVIELAFYGPGSRQPAARAAFSPECGTVRTTIGGQPQPLRLIGSEFGVPARSEIELVGLLAPRRYGARPRVIGRPTVSSGSAASPAHP